MFDDSVATQQITDYLRSLIKENTGILKELEEKALREYIPIISPEVAQLIRLLTEMTKSEKILEIGSAIGYSSILFAGFSENMKITTIEMDEERAAQAEENISRAGMEKRITLLKGNALEVMDELDEQFDLVFVDAAKGQYNNFLPKCLRLLKSGGILVSDNILYRGTVAETGFIPRKHRTIIVNMKEYLKKISEDEKLTTSIIPIGDGVAVSLKKY
ncbi:MAG: O-methyltransferase [Clostridia bacterium]|nr:O-methyltransferase [Clostridia bacterium]